MTVIQTAMTKRILVLGASSGLLATVMSIMYTSSYNSALGSNFSQIISTTGTTIASIIGCMLIAVGYILLKKRWTSDRMEGIFHCSLFILSFVSILGPFSANLPLDIESPELFPGLMIPMHFFPILSWLVLKSFFVKPNGYIS